MSRSRHLVCCLALGLWLPALALAHDAAPQPDSSAKAAASTHFRRGVELFAEEAFRSALVEFERAYEIAPDYRVLYNIGQTQLRVHDYVGAIWSYERYLAEGKDAIAPDRRAQVEQTIVTLRDRVGTIHVRVNRADADVFLDDVKVGSSPLRAPLSANVGRYRVAARAADGAIDARMVDVVGGESASVSLQLGPPVRGADARANGPGLSTRRKLAIASWSVGGLLLATSAVTGALALGEQHELDTLLKQDGVTRSALSDKREVVRDLALTTDLLIGSGAAAVLLGSLLWILDARETRVARAAPSGRRAHAQLRWQLGLAGLSLHGRY